MTALVGFALIVFTVIDLIFWGATPIDFRISFPLWKIVIPGSGIVLFWLNHRRTRRTG